MVVVYGIAVVAGALALVGWLAAAAIAAAPASGRRSPGDRFGEPGRRAVSALLGFGLGGMSASFAGWHPVLALLAAGAGAAGLAAGVRLLADDPS